VLEKKHSANHQTLGKEEPDSGSGKFICSCSFLQFLRGVDALASLIVNTVPLHPFLMAVPLSRRSRTVLHA